MHPIDAAVEAARRRGAEVSSSEGPRLPGPPRWLVLAHFAFAAAAFWTFSAAFFLGAPRLVGFGFQARWVLGLVHTMTLGWAAMTLLGALLQMSSAHGGVALYRPRLAVAAWALLSGGVFAFVGLLWAGSDRYWIGAAAAASGVSCYLVVLAATMLRARQRDVTYWHFANALAYLAALATVGLLLAWDRQRGVALRDPDGALIAHVHLALIGWLSLSIVGASYRLVPRVAAYRAGSPWASRFLLVLANVGLAGLAIDALFRGRASLPWWAAALAAAYALYLWQACRGSRLAEGLSGAFTNLALAGGALWALLGLAMAFGRLRGDPEVRSAYVFAALLGWITPHILAQIHKILPFLVWLALSKRLPKERLPDWQELSSARLAWAQVALLALAVPLGTAGFLAESVPLLRVCGALLLGCASAYVAELAALFSRLLPRGT